MSDWEVVPAEDEFEVVEPSFGLGPQTEIKASDIRDRFRSTISPIIRGLFTAGGATLGGVAGTRAGGKTLPGAALGATQGDLIYQQLQRASPRAFGSPPQNIPEAVTEASMNALLELTTRRIFSSAGPSVLNKIFPNRATKIQLAGMLEENHQLPLDVQDVTQSGFAGLLKQAFGGTAFDKAEQGAQAKVKANIYRLLQEAAKGDVPGIDVPRGTQIAKRGAARAQLLSRKMKRFERGAWNILTKQMLPLVKRNGIEAPITLSSSSQEAATEVARLQKIASKPGLLKEARTQINTAIEYLRPFAGDGTTTPVISYEEAAFNRDALSSLVDHATPDVKGFLASTRRFSEGAIRRDIDNSIASFGPMYGTMHQMAKDATKQYRNTFSNRTLGEALVKKTTTKENVLTRALKNVEAATQYARATGTTSELSEKYLRDVFESTIDPETGFFNAKKGLEYINKNKGVGEFVLDGDLLTRTTNLLGRMSAINPKISNSGKVALAVRYGSALLSIPAGLVTTVKTGSPTTGLLVAGTVTATLPAARMFTRKVLMNPEVGKDLLTLMSRTPEQAQFPMTKLLKTTLNGARMYVQYQGQNRPATVVDGQVVLDPDPTIDTSEEAIP